MATPRERHVISRLDSFAAATSPCAFPNLALHAPRDSGDLLNHFEGLLRTAQVGVSSPQPGGCAASRQRWPLGLTPTTLPPQAGEQESVRRDGLHMEVHAEKLVSAGEDLLKQIHEMRLNLLLQEQEREQDQGAKKARVGGGDGEAVVNAGRAEEGVDVAVPREGR